MENKTIRSKKVMLVDDNEIDLKIHSKIISLTKGFDEIITCSSGVDALNYINKNLNSPEKLPLLILLDIQMPEMNGFEFLEHYKNLPASFTDNCTVVILSSTLDFGDIKRAEANTYVARLIKKPLNLQVITELMEYYSLNRA